MNITYDGNEQETYTLFVDGKNTAELHLGEDAVCELIEVVKKFIENFDTNSHSIEIKNDGDCLGLIVDVWDVDQTDLIDTATFWFEDFTEIVYGTQSSN